MADLQTVHYAILYADGREVPGRVVMDMDDHKAMGVAIRKIVRPVIGEGRHLERIRVWHNDQYLDMFGDEEAAVCDPPLPLNKTATAIYRANALAHEIPTPHPDALPAVHGNVVLFSKQVWF